MRFHGIVAGMYTLCAARLAEKRTTEGSVCRKAKIVFQILVIVEQLYNAV